MRGKLRGNRRRGISLVEVVVAMGVMVVGIGAILQLGTEETRKVAWTRERLEARAELSRLFHALGDRSLQYFADRGLLSEPMDSSGGVVLTFLVRYKTPAGDTREVSARRLVY